MALGPIIRRGAPRFGSESARMLPQARIAGPMPWVMAIMIAAMATIEIRFIVVSLIRSSRGWAER